MSERDTTGIGDRVPGARAGDPDSPTPGTDVPADDGARVNELALAYRAGQADLLPRLFEELRPILRTALGRYGAGGRPLPATLEPGDLLQQSWLILDALARRWDPAGGDFGAYVRTNFAWALWRYVAGQAPGRRARAVRVASFPHDDLLEHLAERAGVDGRAWDGQLVLAELLDALDPLPRRALLLHLLGQQSFEQVARALQLTATGAYREYRRALDHLRRQTGPTGDPEDSSTRGPTGPRGPGPVSEAPGDARALERLVAALHEGADPAGRLPGRSWICARTGLPELRLAHLIGLLVERGCIEGRSARRPGRLVHATPAETLERVASRA